MGAVENSSPQDEGLPLYLQPCGRHLSERIPYSFQYSVADTYSGARFDQGETSDGAGNRQGQYSVNLPDGRLQRVHYHTNDLEGYVAQVTYDGHHGGYAHHPVAHAAGYGAHVGGY